MSGARVFKPENRLRPVLADPRAPTAAELVAAAERNVALLKPRLRAAVEHHREALARLAAMPEPELAAEAEALGAAALGICEVASACDMAAVGEAAKGVYAVILALRADGVWRSDALNAHVAALLQLTAEPPPSDAEARALLARLAGVRAFVGVPT